jgi:hypothetical protein
VPGGENVEKVTGIEVGAARGDLARSSPQGFVRIEPCAIFWTEL